MRQAPCLRQISTSGFPKRRNAKLIIVSIDTLRADHVGHLGAKRPTTPNLDALAAESTSFFHAYAQYPSSQLSFASMFSGLYPVATQVYQRRDAANRLHDDQADRSLAERLGDEGWETVALTALDRPLIDRMFRYQRRGFERFEAADRIRESDEMVDRALELLPPETEFQSFFLWLHLFDPHSPYRQRSQDFGDRAIDAYDSEIAAVDASLGRLIDALSKREDWDRTVLIIHSDHGEEFGDHGGRYHHSSVYEEQLRVPLIVRVPGFWSSRPSRPAELVDLVPTLIELFDLPGGRAGGEPLQGESLLSSMLGSDEAEPIAFAQFREAQQTSSNLDALWYQGWKLIHDRNLGIFELYNLADDPGETEDLANAETAQRDRMARLLKSQLARVAGEDPLAAQLSVLTDDTLPVEDRHRLGLRLLAQGQYRAVAQAFLKMADDPAPIELRCALLDWLGAHGLDAAVPLGRRLLEDKSLELRARAALMLGLLSDVASRAVLQRLLLEDPAIEVQIASSIALGFLGDASQGPALRALLPGLAAADALVARLALASSGDAAARRLCADALASGAWPAREQMILLRWAHRVEQPGLALYAALRRGITRAPLLKAALRALSRLEKQQARAPLRLLLAHHDAEIRGLATTQASAMGFDLNQFRRQGEDAELIRNQRDAGLAPERVVGAYLELAAEGDWGFGLDAFWESRRTGLPWTAAQEIEGWPGSERRRQLAGTPGLAEASIAIHELPMRRPRPSEPLTLVFELSCFARGAGLALGDGVFELLIDGALVGERDLPADAVLPGEKRRLIWSRPAPRLSTGDRSLLLRLRSRRGDLLAEAGARLP